MTQFANSVLPAGAVVLSGQATQTSELLYVFSGHFTSQALEDMLAGGDTALEGHDVHATDPRADFHVPTSQAVHSVPSGPVYPAMHVHDVSNGLFDTE